jgi:hypothetical protein
VAQIKRFALCNGFGGWFGCFDDYQILWKDLVNFLLLDQRWWACYFHLFLFQRKFVSRIFNLQINLLLSHVFLIQIFF